MFWSTARSGSEADLKGLTSAAVTDFVLSASRDHTAGHAKSVTTRLRSFLRYLYVEGLDRGKAW